MQRLWQQTNVTKIMVPQNNGHYGTRAAIGRSNMLR